MPVKRIDPPQAVELLAQGWRYVDVRSETEFEQGHPKGAYNVPITNFVPGRGLAPNPEFLAVFKASFSPDDKVIVGCRTGSRSLRAAELLASQGYANVVDMRGGFEAEPGVPGWRPRGLPVANQPESGRSYRELRAAKPQ